MEKNIEKFGSDPKNLRMVTDRSSRIEVNPILIMINNHYILTNSIEANSMVHPIYLSVSVHLLFKLIVK